MVIIPPIYGDLGNGLYVSDVMEMSVEKWIGDIT